MSDAKRLRLSLLIVLSVWSAACATVPSPNPVAPNCDPGRSDDRNAPIAYVYASTVDRRPVVNPDPLVTNYRVGGRPVVIQWFAGRDADLQITMKRPDQTCVDPPRCSGGRCIAYARPQEKQKSCEYNVTLNGESVDPVIVVEPCC